MVLMSAKRRNAHGGPAMVHLLGSGTGYNRHLLHSVFLTGTEGNTSHFWGWIWSRHLSHSFRLLIFSSTLQSIEHCMSFLFFVFCVSFLFRELMGWKRERQWDCHLSILLCFL